MHRPSELKQLLKKLDRGARRQFSQNFLVDGNILTKIVAAAEIGEGDRVLEVGPGAGAMTEQLLERGASVTAIEIDRDLCRHLREYFSAYPHFTLVEGDALSVDFTALLGSYRWKFVSNLPYHITTPLIEKFLDYGDQTESITCLVQKEVGERLVAEAGDSAYGSLSIFIRYWSTAKLLFTVKPNSFYPAPKVDSCVVQLHPHPPPPCEDPKLLFKVIREAFCYRRKTLRRALERLYLPEETTRALVAIAVDQRVRPEELSLEQFIAFVSLLSTDRQSQKEL